MLSSAAIPTSAPNLSGIFIKRIALIYNQGQYNDYYNLTSLTDHVDATPEPASASLIALGLAGAAFLRRRK